MSGTERQGTYGRRAAAVTENAHRAPRGATEGGVYASASRRAFMHARAQDELRGCGTSTREGRKLRTRMRVYASAPSSSSNSPSSSTVASWYCWYSDTRSFMFDSASVNSISSIPSPVYQWRKALRRNMAVNCSATRLNISWMHVLLPMNVADIFRPFGGM